MCALWFIPDYVKPLLCPCSAIQSNAGLSTTATHWEASYPRVLLTEAVRRHEGRLPSEHSAEEWPGTTSAESAPLSTHGSSPVLELALAGAKWGISSQTCCTDERKRGQSVWPHCVWWWSQQSPQTETGTGCSTEHLERDKTQSSQPVL